MTVWPSTSFKIDEPLGPIWIGLITVCSIPSVSTIVVYVGVYVCIGVSNSEVSKHGEVITSLGCLNKHIIPTQDIVINKQTAITTIMLHAIESSLRIYL